MPLEAPELLLITDPALGDPVGRTERALAGADGPNRRVAVQLRAPRAADPELIRWARDLRAITRARGARLIVNGRVDVAAACGADGVHLPERAVEPAEARRILGANRLVGVSRHDRRGVHRAAEGGADYATLSPFAASPGKGEPLGPDRFAEAVAGTGLPVLALGGIGPEQVGPALDAGASGVAAIRSVYAADDPAGAVRALLAALDRARSGKG